MFKRLFRTKTFWAALTALLTAGERVATGAMSLAEGLQLALPALLALLLRDGVAKSEEAAREAAKPRLEVGGPR
jgi:hypothetical protein